MYRDIFMKYIDILEVRFIDRWVDKEWKRDRERYSESARKRDREGEKYTYYICTYKEGEIKKGESGGRR